MRLEVKDEIRFPSTGMLVLITMSLKLKMQMRLHSSLT